MRVPSRSILAGVVPFLVTVACASKSPNNANGGSAGTSSGSSVTSGNSGSGATSASSGGSTAAGSSSGNGGSSSAGGTSNSSGGSSIGDASADGSGASGPLVVDLDQTLQTMQGFGINDSWAPALTSAQATALFDPNNGIGLSILRVGMGSDGNPLSSNIYDDIKMASSLGVTTFIASVWSAPADCKTAHGDGGVNSGVNGGGFLLQSCYDSWAATIAAFPALIKANTGVDLTAMSPANEPDFASCGLVDPCNGDYPTMLFTGAEAAAFMDVVGPMLHAASPTIKVMSPEPSEWCHLWTENSATGSSNPLMGTGYDYGHALYMDSTAWSQVDIVGSHEYDTQVAQPWPSDVPQTKPIWMTEMAGVKWWPEQGPSSDINDGVVVAGWIHDAIVNGPASAWVWWWYQAQSTNDNEGLLLQDGTDTKRHYVLGNYSKFIRPGYTRVNISGASPAGILLTAYQGADGTVVVVAINNGSSAVTVPISISGGTAPASLTPWVTSATDNLVSQTAVPVSGGSFTAALAATTVTTFVGTP